MRITKLKIKNYKSIKNNTIELNDGMNIFVGDNDAGKSTILEAISAVLLGSINNQGLYHVLRPSIFNNDCRSKYLDFVKNYKNNKKSEKISPPSIKIEVFFDEYPDYKGTNNSLAENSAGIYLEIGLNEDYSELYSELLMNGQISDIPTELYKIKLYSFKGENLNSRYLPFRTVFIDTSKKDYKSVVDRMVLNTVSQCLTDEEISRLSNEYKTNRFKFMKSDIISQINDNNSFSEQLDGKNIKIKMRDINHEAWKDDLTLSIGNDDFDSLGLGTQNRIKVELLLRERKNTIDFVLMEEPENNLSYSNMNKLISKVSKSDSKQFFISTHSSYVANKLSLNNIFIVNKGDIIRLDDVPKDTLDYFNKLPGFDTLRIVLAEKIILVEGPTDELIIQRAYKDKYGHLPIDNGIDIIAVNSLAFKRYLDIAKNLNKKVSIVTDNDGDIKKNIEDRYKDYKFDNFKFFFEKNEELNTIEPSVLRANVNDLGHFLTILSKNGSMHGKSEEEILNFMLSNKAEWALRVFNSEDSINYPEYIKGVISE